MRDRTSACGAAGIGLAKTERFDLLLLDLELPDMRGTDVVEALRGESLAAPFVLISAFLTTEATVAAMRLGAFDVLDKPVSVDDLPGLVRTAVHANEQERVSSGPRSRVLVNLRQSSGWRHKGSAADRWVFNVIQGCLATDDPKTLRRWAEEAAVSYSTLRESCTLVGIEPHDARDLMRMLRAVLQMVTYGSALDTLLDTGDSRTLAQLIATAGFQSAADVQSASIARFFGRQRFVPATARAARTAADVERKGRRNGKCIAASQPMLAHPRFAARFMCRRPLSDCVRRAAAGNWPCTREAWRTRSHGYRRLTQALQG